MARRGALVAALSLLWNGCGSTGLPRQLLAGLAPAPDAAAWRAGRLAVPQVATSRLTIDGDLTDWGDLPLIYLDPRWDQTFGDADPRASKDRALARFAVDDAALCIAVRVVDEEVVNPYDGGALWQGDCFELYLDLRPPTAGADTACLGTDAYTAGVYQLLFAPVDPAGRPHPRWVCLQADAGAPRHLALASRLTRDGYALEIRIPFAQLNQVTAARLAEPFGLDFGCQDIQRTGSGGMARPLQYLWRRRPGSYAHAGNFGRAWVADPVSPLPHLVRYEPIRHAWRDGADRFVAAAVFAGPAGEDSLWFQVRHQGQALDTGAAPPVAPSLYGEAVDSTSTWSDTLLDLHAIEREVRLVRPPAGRYWVTTQVGTRPAVVSDTVRALAGAPGMPGLAVLSPEGLASGRAATPSMPYLHLDTERWHYYAADTARVVLEAAPDPIQQWQAVASGNDASPRVALELVPALAATATPVWVGTAPLTAQPVVVSVPLWTQPPGAYLLRATVPEPNRAAVDSGVAGTVAGTATLLLCRHAGSPPVMAATVDTAGTTLRRATLVAEPNRQRFPGDSGSDCAARSLLDLQTYDGRLFGVGGGGGSGTAGADVWSVAPAATGPVAVVREPAFGAAATDRLARVGDRLVLPDPEPERPGSTAALCLRERGQWRRLPAVPGDGHVAGLAEYSGGLYATAGDSMGGGTYRSSDGGRSWQRLAAWGLPGLMDGLGGELAAVGGGLLVAHHRSGQHILWLNQEGLQRLPATMFPGADAAAALLPWRLVAAQGGVFYTWNQWGPPGASRPLFFLADPRAGGAVVAPFSQAVVEDIVARGDTVFVLSRSAAPVGADYAAEVYRSSVRGAWTRIASFTIPAPARSLEESAGVLYVGLGCDPGQVSPASGQLRRLEPASGSPAPRPEKPRQQTKRKLKRPRRRR
jgi:hypothetical protein